MRLTKQSKEVILGMILSLFFMFLASYLVAIIKYPNMLSNFKGVRQVYMALLGYGFIANAMLYGIFWYLKKEHIQNGVLLTSIIMSIFFIANRIL